MNDDNNIKHHTIETELSTSPLEDLKDLLLPSFTGVQINYYFVCHRELWLFSHGIQMEHNSNIVQLGKLVHENSYQRKNNKEVNIDNKICIDFIDNGTVIHEVKLSDKMEQAHRWQLLYYLYYLKCKGIDKVVGEIDYPKLKQKARVELTSTLETQLLDLFDKIKIVIELPTPPKVEYMKICKTCSYAELCWC